MKHTEKEAARLFAEKWSGRGYEKGETQKFWLEFLHTVLGVEDPYDIINFETQVKLSNTGFIDAYIPSTRVMIEQKASVKELKGSTRQSDGSYLTPFQQAKKYITEMPVDLHPRWVVTCNFRSFLVYDMNAPQGEPQEIFLKDLEKEVHRFRFLIEDKAATALKKELEVSIKAGEIIGRIYDGFLEQYGGEVTKENLHSLNVLCVRLVFLLYAEDAGLFGKNQFFEYLKDFPPHKMRGALRDLFHTLDTPEAERDQFLEPELKAFPYVNGSLFKNEIEIPPLTDKTADILLKHASEDFDWSEISPTIFGAVFESTLNPETRRSGGMHYTSIENIHKVIDPLFLNELNKEFDQINCMPKGKARINALRAFQDKLASLVFLDPACGSGNFLTETYISLRRLENRVIKALEDGMITDHAFFNPIKVNISQFYGIEINDFAATVATTALWIAEAQMMQETEEMIHIDLQCLPLKTNTNIVCANALQIDWNDVVPKEKLNYIMGNPPFVGARWMSKEQKQDVVDIFGSKWKNVGNLDYVSCWYKKSVDLMKDTHVRAALVSTNSISQGEQVANLWEPLINKMEVQIDFAYRTFRWDSEASIKAHVHCVIIGFSKSYTTCDKILYDENNTSKKVSYINPYLLDAPCVFIESRNVALCNVPELNFGSMPNDGGYLLLSEDEKNEIISERIENSKYIRRIKGAIEFIQNKPLYCLWLVDVSPSDINKSKLILNRIILVRDTRLKSQREATKKHADTPFLFAEIRQPKTNYIAIPKVSSEKRKYIPMGFESPEIIAKDQLFIIPSATLYHFGILESIVHNAWMRAVCGRMKSDYNYSKNIVYNNFPWPTVTDEQKEKIEQTAQAILDARALYPDCSLADLYDETTMPSELRKAHQANDKAVMAAYGFHKDMEESQIVSELMKLYQSLTQTN